MRPSTTLGVILIGILIILLVQSRQELSAHLASEAKAIATHEEALNNICAGITVIDQYDNLYEVGPNGVNLIPEQPTHAHTY